MTATKLMSPEMEQACKLFVQELELRGKASQLTDGELARILVERIWPILNLYTYEGVLINEAISRLKRADTQRRWDERRARRQ